MSLWGQSLSAEAFPVCTLKPLNSTSSKHKPTYCSSQLNKQICCLSLLPPQPFIYFCLVNQYLLKEQPSYYKWYFLILKIVYSSSGIKLTSQSPPSPKFLCEPEFKLYISSVVNSCLLTSSVISLLKITHQKDILI